MTDCKVMVFVFNENNTDISEYSTVDPREMMQMYVEQAVYPHERFTNEDYDTIGLKPAERKRLGLNAPGRREVTEIPVELQHMGGSSRTPKSPKEEAQTDSPAQQKKRPKRTRSKSKTTKPNKKRKIEQPIETPEEIARQQEALSHDRDPRTDFVPPPSYMENGNSGMGTSFESDGGSLGGLANAAASVMQGSEEKQNASGSMPRFKLEDPNKTGPLKQSGTKRAFSSPAFRIGLTPSPGAIQTPRSGDDVQSLENINTYFSTANGGTVYSPNLDELLTTPRLPTPSGGEGREGR